jgi:hypothetical protein
MKRSRPSHPALVAVVALVAGLLAAAPADAEVRSVRVVLENADLTPDPVETESSHLAGVPDHSTDSWFTSSVQDPRQSFAAVGSHWKAVADSVLQLSVSPDGVHWGRWITVPADETIEATREDGEPNPFAGETLGALVFVDPSSRFLRCRVRRPVDVPASPEPGRISLHVIDPGTSTPEGPTRTPSRALPEPEIPLADSEAAGLSRRAAAPPPEIPDSGPGAPKPLIFTRAQWGARPPRTGYTTTLAGHIGIHHTATVEDFAASTWEECAARVRAIQTYHIDAQGWNDIGYAYVVCKHGHVFQAREDDDDTTDLQGAHDGFNRGSTGISAFGYFHPPVDHQPTEAQLSAIVQLTAWISSRRDIDPLGRTLYPAFGVAVDNIYGHREVSATACPGDHLYRLKGDLRTAVSERVLRQLY